MKTIIILFIFACTGLLSQNITNTLGTSGIFSIKNSTSTYLTLNQSTGNLSLNRSLILPNTTSSGVGVLFIGANPFLHNFGVANTFAGTGSGNFTMSGIQNCAYGFFTLSANTTGELNTAVGYSALISNTEGSENTAFGYSTLFTNTTGNQNTAVGYNSLNTNTTGNGNTAIGHTSLYRNSTGGNNTALGYESLNFNTTGDQNTAIGFASMYANATGRLNTALGVLSLSSNTTGGENTAIGNSSLSNSTGSLNTALGYGTGTNLTTGTNNTLIGFNAEPTSGTVSNQITLGNSSVTSLRCNVTTITSLSDARDKKNIKDLSLGLDFIAKLKPRQFNWDKREWYDDNISDGSKMKEEQTAGFIAQELDEAQTTGNAEWLNLVLKDNPEKWEATSGNLLPVMVKAIQELKAENDDLKKKLGNVEKLQNMLVEEIAKLKVNTKENLKVSDVISK